MCPENCNTYHEFNNKPFDLREFFVIDKDYYFGKLAPIVLFVPHSRLRAPSSFIFDLAF